MYILSQTLQIYSLEFNLKKNISRLIFIIWIYGIHICVSIIIDIFNLHYSILDYWRRQWHLTPVLLPGKSHGWRSLVGCSPWGCEESDMTEQLHFPFSLSCIGEGNGNPLQCSCLGNPRDGGSWWAAVCGVTQSRTRLKWLSSSSSIPSLYQLGTRHTFQIATTQNI